MLHSLIAAGNSFQMVGAEKLKERLLMFSVYCLLSCIYVANFTALMLLIAHKKGIRHVEGPALSVL